MARQDLRAREEAIAVEELGTERVSIQQARNHFKDRGLIITDEDSINQWELDQARAIMERSRKYRKRTKEIQLEMISLYETLPDGGRVHYWRRFGELTPEEGAQLLGYWNDRFNYDIREFYRYYKPLVRMHGRKIKQLIWWELPPKPSVSEA